MSKRLTRDDWIDYGLKSLSKAGFKSLKAESLAKALQVSRGSFYWHFTNMAEFELELMHAWRQHTTESVITELESDQSAESRLIKLVGLALSNKLNLDKAMRSWSMEDNRALKIVREVDHHRITYIESLLEAISVNKQDLALRAKLLYWSSIGRSIVEPNSKSRLRSTEIESLITMFSS